MIIILTIFSAVMWISGFFLTLMFLKATSELHNNKRVLLSALIWPIFVLSAIIAAFAQEIGSLAMRIISSFKKEKEQ